MTAPAGEVVVVNGDSWAEHVPALAQLLRMPGEPGRVWAIPDRLGRPADQDRVVTLGDPAYWASHPRELEEVLILAGGATGGIPVGDDRLTSGAASRGQERLTMTIEEAAAALGISRAFAYEAAHRGEIPIVRIGRRMLVPRAALNKMLEQAGRPGEERR